MRFCPVCHLPYPEPDRVVCVLDGAELIEGESELEGMLLSGRYRIERLLGAGGMAQVYRAHSTVSGAVVAVKIMHAHLSSDAELRERFRREAKNAAQLSHENVIEVYDAGETPTGRPYIVMELLEGETLRDVLARGPLPLEAVVRLGLDIGRGLARAHDLGVIHRDLKPENVFVCPRPERKPDGKIGKLVDFGIARAPQESRLTAAGSLIGTPAYIAPERVRGHENDASSDLYSMGVVLFEMITGRLPFLSDDVPGFLLQNLEAPPPPPSQFASHCPPPLEALVLQLLEKEPSRRPVDAHQVVRDLEAIERALPKEAKRATAERAGTAAGSDRPSRPAMSTLERWEQRVVVLGQLLQRAYPDRVPAEELMLLSRLETEVGRLTELRRAQLATHAGLDRVVDRTKEDRERLGHAVHELGVDLSAEREALVSLRAELSMREARVADLELQLGELRRHLTEKEELADDDRAEAERGLRARGAEIESVQQAASATTRALVEALKESPLGPSVDLSFD